MTKNLRKYWRNPNPKRTKEYYEFKRPKEKRFAKMMRKTYTIESIDALFYGHQFDLNRFDALQMREFISKHCTPAQIKRYPQIFQVKHFGPTHYVCNLFLTSIYIDAKKISCKVFTPFRYANKTKNYKPLIADCNLSDSNSVTFYALVNGHFSIITKSLL